MPVQNFKAIYFPDYKVVNPNAKGFILAFGQRTKELYQQVAPLTSHEVRELLGTHSFVELERSATQEGLPVNTFCMWKLQKVVDTSNTLFPHPILKDKVKREINPAHVTFRGGKQNPLHNWYSFLEGYSPQFVEFILDNFAKKANTIYDPFAGTGVTPIVASQRGLSAFYSEINPLLQFLTQTKINASAFTPRRREKIIENLENIKVKLDSLIKNANRDHNLFITYQKTFGKSKFFDDKTFDLVSRTRTLADELSYSNQLVSDIVLVAILNSLIPSSLLQRAGDLRYKNYKELQRKESLIEAVKQNLTNVIEDVKQIEPLPQTPVLISENAKLVDRLPKMKIDAIITSPPYLNGTNYFRNTKIELWFLRSIKTPEDLSDFRRASVTAGINDVSQKKPISFTTKKIEEVVTELKEKAYDQRIPKMVTDYFQDVSQVFNGLKKHLTTHADIAIDIGDSVYGGVKVPTDELFIDLLNQLDYRFEQSIVLRKRLSRSGDVLKQVLLIFKAPLTLNKNVKTKLSPSWRVDWSNFKKTLPHKIEPYCKRNWGHPLHSLCSYQGKMKPSLAYFLVKIFTKKGDKILDPFAGVGTIPFEGALNGVKSFGFEISHAALAIAKAKMGKPDKDESFNVVNKLEKYLKESVVQEKAYTDAQNFGFNKKLIDYYNPQTLKEIVRAREYFKENPPLTISENLVFASLLHILHGNRPYALSRRSHGITPFAPTGNFEYKPLIKHLREKVARSFTSGLPDEFVEGEMLYQDATSWWPRQIDNLDAIITSPPFFDSTRFYLANWLRLWFSGWDQRDFKEKPLGFVDEKQKNDFAIYEPILRQARERLKPGGRLVFHLGKSRKCDMTEQLSEMAKRWFKVVDVFEENVEDTESHGIRDKGTVVKHQFLILQ